MYEQILIQNGLLPKEAKVYLAVLEIGEATMSMISRNAKIERPTVYDIVHELQTKGIVFVNKKKGIKYVSAVSPRILIDRFKDSFGKAEAILPDLLNIAYKSPLKPRIKFYEGLNGLKEILKEFSFAEEETYLFTDYQLMPKELYDFILDEIIPERIKREKNFARILVPDNEQNRKVKSEDKERFTEHRIVTFPLQQTNPLEIILFEDKIGFLSYTKDEMFGLIIDSAVIHQTLKNIFFLVWNVS
jgi:HTH-type transcriptional regulator, sugar sensing transcriptional regulator